MSITLSPPTGFSTSDLVFNDSFSGTSLNATYWNTFMTSNSTQGGAWDSNGTGGSGLGGSNDAEYFVPGEVSVSNGLTIGAIKQSVAGANYVGGAVVPQTFAITAGVVDSYGKFEFDGGYLQISMQAPSGNGSWPSLWLLPGAGAGNVGNNFEIDIEEGGYTDGSANPNDVLSYHLHTPSGTFGGVVNTGVNLTSGYNTYGIYWVPGQSITWYLNGVEVAQITSAQATIPNEPMELIMSNQVATTATSSWHTTLGSSTPSSMPMQIADVQLYQLPGSGDTLTLNSSTTLGVSTLDPLLAVAGKGGTVPLGITETAPANATSASVTIKGLPSYETITDKLDGDTFSGSSITLTEAEVNSGLTLKSTYTGSSHPSATLTITASATVGGVTSTSAAQTIKVTDPTSSTSRGAAQLIQHMASGLQNSADNAPLTTNPSTNLAQQQTSPFLATPHHA